MPTILHTSDVHLGAPLGWLGEASAEQRRQLGETFARVVDLALEEQAECLLICGDLFDSNQPPASAVRLVLNQLARLREGRGTLAVILPGSHDPLGPTSVYTSYRRELDELDTVKVLGFDNRTTVRLGDCGIAVHGRASTKAGPSAAAPAGFQFDEAVRFNVVMAHGSVEIGSIRDERHPIDAELLRYPAVSYFALGHWHSWLQVQKTPAPAVYPGAPELVASDQLGSGHVARVVLAESGASVERVNVGARTVMESEIDLTDCGSEREVVERVARSAPPDPNVVLRLTLCGLVDTDSTFDEASLVEALRDRYFHVGQPKRHYHVRMSDEDLARLPERLVVGRYARIMAARLRDARTEDEREEIETALMLGVALLKGKEALM